MECFIVKKALILIVFDASRHSNKHMKGKSVMKDIYVSDLHTRSIGCEVMLLGWIRAKRHQGKVIFLDVCDSTGTIQAVIEEQQVGQIQFNLVKGMPVESAIAINGTICVQNARQEVNVRRIYLVGGVTKPVSPSPRGDVDIFDERLTDQLLSYRHLYLRNPKLMAILKLRDTVMSYTRQWFHENHFTAIDAPVLTPVPLYEDRTAISVTIHGEKVFLTQCVGYYLEAAVHAFERVYNMGPSFRNEESRSRRHLLEYWHIKAEVAWANLGDIIGLVESLMKYIIEHSQDELERTATILGRNACLDGLRSPFTQITYEEALKILSKCDFPTEFGNSLGSREEEELSKVIGKPFWVSGIPRMVEPFPYVIDPTDSRITRVADLIASNGYGELLGTAEKIHDIAMLEERMRDKDRHADPRYEFVRDVHQVGCVPHAAFGMGVERLIRWLLNIPHVRDAIPFPRMFRRRISP
ncbi:MAG TPA: hypothetical protein DEF00_01670 [Candidatus Taylorbacteria bacterium]|nr:MAG: Asparaginyl-tRNA synthetase [Parcubacteria group bacterium GW2011_GWA2_47_64]KKU96732.1 MAG: Asparaginyl-tRNA synthetase [Parcubacteria group bacterium GW2011_GWC2_48_17]HBV01085.1 hypothetical protein [Candidatus Taylorbacteria bacterium]